MDTLASRSQMRGHRRLGLFPNKHDFGFWRFVRRSTSFSTNLRKITPARVRRSAYHRRLTSGGFFLKPVGRGLNRLISGEFLLHRHMNRSRGIVVDRQSPKAAHRGSGHHRRLTSGGFLLQRHMYRSRQFVVDRQSPKAGYRGSGYHRRLTVDRLSRSGSSRAAHRSTTWQP